VPQGVGYHHAEGSVESAAGCCRPFDADADGTIMSSGVGAIVVKRLSSALRDGDYVHAVIKGSAVNNDGSHKVSFAAPSVAGQHAVIAQALSNANVAPASISYVEAHGTGTKLGDPIEISALVQAFGVQGERCEIGAVKSNVGHLDSAAGIAGLIKTVLMLEHQQRVPTANFRRLNPLIELDGTRFEIGTQGRPWTTAGQPLRAGVSSFGIGGSNAHVILEAAAQRQVDFVPRTGSQLILLSASNAAALGGYRQSIDAAVANMERSAREHAAYTLAVGRKHREYRQAFLLHDEGGSMMIGADTARLVSTDLSARPLVLVLSRWDALPLEWIEPLSGSFAEFRRNFHEVCRAAGDDEIDPATYMRPAGQSRRVQEVARFGLAYSLLKSLACWIEFDTIANHGHASLLLQAVSDSARLTSAVGEYVRSRTGPAAESRADAVEAAVLGKEGVHRRLFDPSPAYPGAGLDPRMSDGVSALLAFMGGLWLDGVRIDWAGCYRERALKLVPLPPYPYQRERFWYSPSRTLHVVSGDGATLEQVSAPRRSRPADHLEPYVGPRNPVETEVVGILERVLGVDSIGVHDDFFALGGHSLLATRMIEELRDAFGVAIAVEDWFERLTAAQMAEYVESQRVVGIDPRTLTDALESQRQALAP
jgi:acyl carrier protein